MMMANRRRGVLLLLLLLLAPFLLAALAGAEYTEEAGRVPGNGTGRGVRRWCLMECVALPKNHWPDLLANLMPFAISHFVPTYLPTPPPHPGTGPSGPSRQPGGGGGGGYNGPGRWGANRNPDANAPGGGGGGAAAGPAGPGGGAGGVGGVGDSGLSANNGQGVAETGQGYGGNGLYVAPPPSVEGDKGPDGGACVLCMCIPSRVRPTPRPICLLIASSPKLSINRPGTPWSWPAPAAWVGARRRLMWAKGGRGNCGIRERAIRCM